MARKVVILGTGGTIAGRSAEPGDDLNYVAGQIGVAQLAAVPGLAGRPIEAVQVAQLDSKDMTLAVQRSLAEQVQANLDRAEVAGVVVTHGTDTLEETAYLLHAVLRTDKPVVLTAAMRPATSPQADGPQNLLDAVTLAGTPGLAGVAVVLGGRVYAGAEIRKVHGHRVDAFSAGDAGVLGTVAAGHWQPDRDWPAAAGRGLAVVPTDDAAAPWVAIVTSHAGVTGREVDVLVAAGVHGLVVAATGNGTIHERMVDALRRARSRGVAVRVASRCLADGIAGTAGAGFESAGALTPAQARIELMLHLRATTADAGSA